MATVDDRVVQLKFDNKQFETATATSMGTLDKLKKSLETSISTKGVDGLTQSFNPLGTTIEGASTKFLAMATIGITALSRITNAVISTGEQLVKSFTIDQISAGWADYEKQINATQTIMANTGLEGAKGLKVVEKTLADLNEYANLTIYDFSQMTENIGRFTAAGVAIAPATDAIKGMSNAAALTGANAMQLGSAMYQVSQALATGTIKLMDWNSLSNANMGTQNIQSALKATAMTLKDHGAAMTDAIAKTGNFRDSLSSGWLTTEVFTKAMGVMAGTVDAATGKYRAFTVAELKGKGYTEASAKALNKLSQAAIDSAINIRTYTQMQEALKEGVATAWGTIFKTIFGNIFGATQLFTNMYNVLYDFFTKPLYQLNAFIAEFVKFGGMISIVKMVGAAFGAISSYLTPIKNAWAQVFPAGSTKDLVEITREIRRFIAAITLSPAAQKNLQYTFQGFFSVLDIGRQIIGGVIGFVKSLFNIFTSGGQKASGGILDVTGSIGLALVNFDRFLKGTNAIPAFFDRLTRAIGPTVAKLGDLVRTVSAAVGGAIKQLPNLLQSIGGAATNADQTGLTPLQKTMQALASVWDWLVQAGQKVLGFFGSVASQLKGSFDSAASGSTNITQTLQNFVQNIDWYRIFQVAVGGAAIAVITSVIRAIWGAVTLFIAKPNQILGSIAGVMDSLAGVLDGYQKNLQAGALLKIAFAIGVLALSLKLLSTIDGGALAASTAAILFLMGGLAVIIKQFSDAESMKDSLKMASNVSALGIALIGFGIAIALLAFAVKQLGQMNADQLKQGLTAISMLLLALGVAVKIMPSQAQMVGVAASIVAMAVAITLLSGAIFILGKMNIDVLRQGMLSVAFMLAAIGVAIALMPTDARMLGAAAAIIALSIAVNVMGIAISKMGGMDPKQLNQGMMTVVEMLAALTAVLLVLGTNATGVLGGAAAILVVSAGLMVLANVLAVIGAMDPMVVMGALAMIIVSMAAIGIMAMALSEAIPFIIMFGVGLMALGAGFALFGLGALAFAAAFSIIVGILSLGFPIISRMITDFIQLLPLIGEAAYQAMIVFADAFIRAVPTLVAAAGALGSALLDEFQKLFPKLMTTLGVLFDVVNAFLIEYIPKFADTGLKIINGLLKVFKDNSKSIIDNGKGVIIKWIEGLGAAASEIAAAAGTALLKFLQDITKWINDNRQNIEDTTKALGQAIVDGITAGVMGFFDGPINLIRNLGNGMIAAFKMVLGIHSPSKVFTDIGQNVMAGLTNGLLNGKDAAIKTVNDIINSIKTAAGDAFNKVNDLKATVKDLESKPMTAANKAALAKAKADLKLAIADKARLDAAYKTVTAEHKAQLYKLEDLANQYDVLAVKLKDAQKALEDVTKQRDDYAKSISDKYSALPTIDATSSLDDYFNAIRDATQANIKFKATMEQLRNLGLDDTQYKKFMEQGTAIQPFLDQLLGAGGDTISELNNIDLTLTESASNLGLSASKALYQAGVDAAQGLVDGINAQMTTLATQMKTIGKVIADEIKKELGIHSPSKVFAAIGGNTMKGLAQGIDANSNIVDLASRRAGKTAIDGMKESMSGLADAISSDIDVQPTIAPVLDLDQFRKDAVKIDGLLAPAPLQASVSTQNAVATNSALEATKAAIEASTALQATGTSVELTQINNSPKALSSAEIYRNTKNQLSVLKGALSN